MEHRYGAKMFNFGIVYARHYSQEDMCIIGKGKEGGLSH